MVIFLLTLDNLMLLIIPHESTVASVTFFRESIIV